MKWGLPEDPAVDALAARVEARDDMTPSKRALFHTVRTWDSIMVIGFHIAAVVFGCSTIAAAVLFFLDIISGFVVFGAAMACAGVFGMNALWQQLQRALLGDLLVAGVRNDNVGGVLPVAIPATREPGDDVSGER